MAADPLLFYPAAPNRPPSDPAPDDPRKVKFLCSFGGQIIPRPSDGALRYAGGQTRIISVRRDAPLPEIMNKMAEVFGGHAALRYQLPDVDLDALVSVSSLEDLENMMEEYDKIAEAAPDGSAKLRVFLFSPSDLAADPASLLDLEDYSQRYVEAVNRISSDGSLRRKDSLASASSAHNSGGGINGGTSPEILSPTAAAANDSSRLFFVGAPSPAAAAAGFPDPPVLPANPPVASSNATTSRVELSPYTSQPYADPNQFQYMNSQPMGTPPGSLPISSLAIPPPQYQYAPVASHVGTEKSVPAIVDSYGGRTTQLHGDPNSRAGNQLVPPTYLQPQNVELYGVRQVVPPPMQGQGYRLEDCYMCHKALPHAHSDTQVQEHGSATSEASTTFHSLRAEDATRLGTPNRVIAPPMTENKVAAGPFVSYGFAPIPEVRHDNEKLVVPNVVSDHSSALHPPAAMGFPSDTQASSGMFVNVPKYRREDSLQKQQQQSLVQPQPMVKQDGIVELYRNGVYPVKNVNLQATEALNLGHVPEFPSNHPGPLEGMMETLRGSPFDNSMYNEERKPTVTPNLVISKELKPEEVPLVEINHPVRPHVGGNTSFMGSGFRNPGIMQEGSYTRPVDQLLASSLGFTQSQNLQPNVSSQVSTQDTFFINHETGREPMVPSKVLHAMPAYSCSINPVQTNNNTNTVPDGDRKDEASRYSKDMLGDFAAPTSIKFPFPFPNSIRPTQQVELFDEPILPDSLFPSQDPIKISGGTNFLPPRPIRVASRESVIAKDLSTENLSIANQGPDIALLLDDNVFYQPLNSLIKDSCREPVARGTRGSEEEQINKELQAVAEGAATAVLQSSAPPMPVFVARETKGSTSQFNIEGVIDDITSSNNATFLGDHRVEDTKSKPAENLNSGFLIGDEIGRLQIIKNSDLEELKELGSGTFGTVYHGKWRGSDVAIKRINNRCFAGKPSEQERTRADFWNEASKLSDLHHPNVVAFYGVVVDGPGGSVATVTEYMVNGSLRQALQKNDKTFDRSKRLLIAMDVAFGMEYLHSKNIVHFDLKSDNLLVNLRDPQRPICKVGDLGLSKVKCQTLISGGVRGTLPWMAPELLNGSSSLVSEKVDVFSFGIVMWEILTGKEPYADMHYGAIIGGIVSNTLRPPVPETCELDWRLLMERCWSSEPSERPSFTEIASGLRAMAASPSSKGR